MKTRKGTCTKETFWEAVAEIGWGTKTTDYKVVERGILENWDNEFISSFESTLREHCDKLARKVENYEDRNDVSCQCGDDSFSDLTHHVVGLGKEAYEAAMKDPMLVVKRGQEYKYTESFNYCLPYLKGVKEKLTFEQALEKARAQFESDGGGAGGDVELFLEMEALELMMGAKAKLSSRYYATWAKRVLLDLKALWHSNFAEDFAPDLVDIIGILERVSEGEIGVVFDNPDLKDRVKALREKRGEIYRRELKKLEVLQGPGWSLDNLVGDIRQYLGDDNAA